MFDPTWAQEELSDDVMISELKTDTGITLSVDLSGIEKDNNFFIHYLGFLDSVGIESELFESGNILIVKWPEHTEVVVDKIRCTVLKNKKEILSDCTKFSIVDGDLYVSQSLINDIFGIRLLYEKFKLLVTLSGGEKFPLVIRRNTEKAMRESDQKNSRNLEINAHDSTFSPHRTWIDGGTLDQQLKYNVRKNRHGVQSLSHFTSLQGEVLHSELKADAWSNDDGSAGSMIRLRYRPNYIDKSFNYFSEVSVGDFQIPQIDLIGDTSIYRGALLSTFDHDYQINSLFKTFSGPLPSGWIVELYANEVFIGRQAESAGYYNFSNVPYLIGPNVYRFVFIGPSGQKSEIVERYFYDLSSATARKFNYKLAYGQYVLTSGSTSLVEGFKRSFGLTQFEGLLAADTRISFALLNRNTSKDSENYYVTSLKSNVLGPLLNFVVVGSGENGLASQVSVLGDSRWGIFTLAHAQYRNFRVLGEASDPFLSSRSQLMYQFRLPGFNLQNTVRSTYSQFGKMGDDKKLSLDSSYAFFNFNFFNSISFSNSTLVGNFYLNYIYDKFEYRLLVNHFFKTIDSYTTGINYRQSSELFANFLTTVGRLGEWRSSVLSITRRFNSFSITLGADKQQSEYGAHINLNYALLYQSEENSISASISPQTDLSSVLVLVCNDENEDNTCQSNESRYEHIKVNFDDQTVPQKSDQSGYIWVFGVRPYVKHTLELDTFSLPDANLVSTRGRIAVYLRPGKVPRIEFPLVRRYEVFGRVIGLKNPRGYKVELLDSSGAKSLSIPVDSYKEFYNNKIKKDVYTVQLIDAKNKVIQSQHYDLLSDTVPEEIVFDLTSKDNSIPSP